VSDAPPRLQAGVRSLNLMFAASARYVRRITPGATLSSIRS